MISRKWFWFAIALAILAGAYFRVEHIERRLFWADESWTALRISGHRYTELRRLFDGRVHLVAEISRFQQIDPSRSTLDTISGLAVEEPQHPPVFYVLDRYWALLFGSSIPALRSLALIFSLGAIVAIAWLCFELSQTYLVAGAAAALMAVSPFFVNYGAQAREYSLWAMLIALTSVLLLRASRSTSISSWIWYALTMAVALYSDLLMTLVLAAHAAFIVIRERGEPGKLIRFGIAAGAALLVFLPWLAIAALRHNTIWSLQTWTRTPYPLLSVLDKWVFNTGTVLFDAEYANMRLAPIAAVMLLLLAYSVIRLVRDEKAATVWFITLLGAVVALPQILIDILTHGHASTESRYLIPLWTALLAAVALFFGRRLARGTERVSATWLAAFCCVLAIGALSSAINSSAVGWWDNDDDYPSTAIGAQINASHAPPLVVSEGLWAEVLVMSHYVAPGTRFLLFQNTPPFPLPVVRNVFLLAPSPTTLAAFNSRPQYRLEALHIAPLLSSALLSFRKSVQKAQPKNARRLLPPHTYLFRVIQAPAVPVRKRASF